MSSANSDTNSSLMDTDTSDLGDTPAKGKTKQKNEEMAAIARTMGA